MFHGSSGIHRPHYTTTCKTRVARGVNGSLDHFDVTLPEGNDYLSDVIQQYHHHTEAQREAIIDEFDFSLNVLLEYNNETVLLSQERGKPVHFPNLMLPQSGTALPSQEDAYLNS